MRCCYRFDQQIARPPDTVRAHTDAWRAHVPEPPGHDPDKTPDIPPPRRPEEDIDLPPREDPTPVHEPEEPPKPH